MDLNSLPWMPRTKRTARTLLAALGLAAAALPAAHADINLADKPLFSSVSVPGNLILALSVEWPTATTPAYPSTTAYSSSSTFLGYFDPAKCYQYVAINTGTTSSPDYSTSYFTPMGAASSHACSSSSSLPLWSGNYLNWAAMQTLDTFRWVLTGGYRSVDSSSSTVLTKTYAAQDSSVMPQKTVASASLDGATPFTAAKWTSGATTRLRNLGSRMWITSSATGSSSLVAGTATSGAVAYTGQNSYVSNSSSSYAAPATTYELYISVKVCDSSTGSGGVEDNCVLYGSNYKPEGLMQTYSSKLRYSAFGYYNHSGTTSQQRDGGVMRARMKYIGPARPVPGSTSVTNSNAEWSSSTGIMAVNPDSDDASATQTLASNAGWSSVTIANSGVMNYLNKFGYSAKSYKSKDPVSELYYAALRYYKNLGNVASYTTLSGAGSAATATAWLDGFPAITSSDVWQKSSTATDAYYGSPILYSCQKNFILGIGDVNTHRDGNLYGSTIASSLEPSPTPTEVSADTSVNVKTATDMVGQLEGLSGSNTLGSLYGDSSSTTCASTGSQCNTYFIAGLAYDAHTNDIRSDLTGKQTVSTYWMDVLENQVYKHKNQYWLATKYGGFTVPTGFSAYASSNSTSTIATANWYTTSDTLTIGTTSLTYWTDASTTTDKRPDNYFPGNQADVMKSGLTSAFAKIVSESTAATGTALSTPSANITSSGAVSYSASYDPANWTGKVVASKASFSSGGTPTTTDQWDARALLSATSVTASTRKIVTCCTAAGAGLPFTNSDLTGSSLDGRTYYASFGSVPGVSTASQSVTNYIAYLRGDTAQEVKNGGAYRDRSYRLGDIVNSKPLAVAAPSFPYYDVYNPGYSAFKSTYSGRKTVVYVGANDGMLHAFDGSTGASSSGSELFAYIPSFTYGSSSTAASTGLASLGNPTFTHHYFVDGTPRQFDLDMSKTSGAASTAARDWRTVLIGGLGKGGKGYYAIDVTNPTAWTSETAVASKVLWEFTDSRMGYSYGEPSVVKTAKYGWVVILTSGYNNSDGVGYFFIVNPRTGALLEAVATPTGSTSEPINLAKHTSFIPDYTDMTADAVYAADLRGNVWRLDLTPTSASYSAPTLIATLANGSGTAQPAMTHLQIEIEPNSQKRYVLAGTGQLLGDTDISSSSMQSFYAIVDGTSTSGRFYTTATLPSGATFPITRSQLEPDTDLRVGIGSSPTKTMGWYFDMPVTSGIAERMDVDMAVNQGIVAFAGNLPNGSVCSPGGTPDGYAVNMATGQTVLVDSTSTLIAKADMTAMTGVVTEVAILRVDGKLRLYFGGNSADGTPKVVQSPANLTTASGAKQLNWRAVQLSN